eukprot:RCo041251
MTYQMTNVAAGGLAALPGDLFGFLLSLLQPDDILQVWIGVGKLLARRAAVELVRRGQVTAPRVPRRFMLRAAPEPTPGSLWAVLGLGGSLLSPTGEHIVSPFASTTLELAMHFGGEVLTLHGRFRKMFEGWQGALNGSVALLWNALAAAEKVTVRGHRAVVVVVALSSEGIVLQEFISPVPPGETVLRLPCEEFSVAQLMLYKSGHQGVFCQSVAVAHQRPNPQWIASRAQNSITAEPWSYRYPCAGDLALPWPKPDPSPFRIAARPVQVETPWGVRPLLRPQQTVRSPLRRLLKAHSVPPPQHPPPLPGDPMGHILRTLKTQRRNTSSGIDANRSRRKSLDRLSPVLRRVPSPSQWRAGEWPPCPRLLPTIVQYGEHPIPGARNVLFLFPNPHPHPFPFNLFIL